MLNRTLISTLFMLIGLTVRADLIVNGSFEQASVNPGATFVELSGGSTAITGWTVTGNTIDYIGGYWQHSLGQRSIDLSGSNAGGIEQTFATTVGQAYTVLFDLAGNPQGAPTIKTVEVSVAGQQQNFTFDTTGKSFTDMGWTTKTLNFTAIGGLTTLSFTNRDVTQFGPTLDNVRVNLAVVPEPASLITLGVGAVGLMAYAWHRRMNPTHKTSLQQNKASCGG
jgi:choice-of-anchor C domain-containing protein